MVIELNNYEGNDDREEISSIKRGRDFNIVIFRLQEVFKKTRLDHFPTFGSGK